MNKFLAALIAGLFSVGAFAAAHATKPDAAASGAKADMKKEEAKKADKPAAAASGAMKKEEPKK